jgi:hypothetical protein
LTCRFAILFDDRQDSINKNRQHGSRSVWCQEAEEEVVEGQGYVEASMLALETIAARRLDT